MKDTYKSISQASEEVLFKDRNSKFFGYAFPVQTEEVALAVLEKVKKKHPKAGHFCFAWQLGKEEQSYRTNDDGEPANSAGMPIYGQLQSFELTNIMLIVVRYFGGTKLGVGGLISAYKTTAKMALESSKILTRTIDEIFQLEFDYPEMNIVMRIIKENNLNIIDQKLALDCKVFLSVRKNESEAIFSTFENTYKVKVKRIKN